MAKSISRYELVTRGEWSTAVKCIIDTRSICVIWHHTLRRERNGRYVRQTTFSNTLCVNENMCIMIQMSPKFVRRGSHDIGSDNALVPYRSHPLSEPQIIANTICVISADWGLQIHMELLDTIAKYETKSLMFWFQMPVGMSLSKTDIVMYFWCNKHNIIGTGWRR